MSRNTTVKVALGLANQNNHHIRFLDIKNAFVQAYVHDNPIFMQQPQGYEETGADGEKLVCKLNKYIYGLLQASREFNLHLRNILINKLGFSQSENDTCLYIHKATGITFVIYVDDIIATAESLRKLNEMVVLLGKFVPIKCELPTQILGIQINYNKEKGILTMDQIPAIEKLIDRFQITDAKIMRTPMEYNWHPHLYPENRELVESFPVRSALGAI